MLKMANRGNFKEEEEEEQVNCCNVNNNNKAEADDHEDERISSIKTTISCHPFYPILVESHLHCLKLCLGDNEDIIDAVAADHIKLLEYSSLADQSDLDQFMEAYCITLKKLKEAIEEPQRESIAFIKNMHSQLEKLKDRPASEQGKAGSN